MVRELEDNNLNVLNAMFHYKLLNQQTDYEEADILASEYKVGKIDVSKINSKFQKQKENKKRREEMLKRKKDQSQDIFTIGYD
tara:strand:- start:15 stop:263 length:249 start_codon:yes stop_codon:yes gene_type:complete